ncbi:HAMP domain-containing protein [Paenibacillus sp. SYP-B3998]|uniref:Heme sensor protein HssS n=1 Tax=Paenibacillus sp. SYP-B3998 TaxID=2678564 RepID=A0A6G4A2I6_9BACL|nr:HAMP domain-containing sensor histidine kinase [Paenibacillus sp. SYP-B3998]NEW08683.1 HAMP domain-containing protein [Paenibacillus sp. SYP-B3998]
MIKTLYLRVVLTFSAVVVISILLSFLIAMLLYTNRISTEVLDNLLKVGKQLVTMSNDYQPLEIKSFLEASTKLNDGYSLILFDSSGDNVAFSIQSKNESLNIKAEEVEQVLQGQIYKSMYLNYGYFGEPTRLVVGVPLSVKDKQYALFVMPKFTEESRKQSRTLIITVLLIVLIIGSVLILIASRYIVSPIKKLTLATNRLARGNFNVKVTVKRKDEIGLLAEGFNHMAGELKQLEQMRQDFVSNVSHEIQSPLTSIRGFSKALKQPDLKDEDRLRYLEIIERESERLSRLSENLLKLASLESEHHPFKPTTFDLDEQLRRVAVSYEPQWSAKQLDMDMDLPRVKITADADQLSQVWMNLLGNAIKFTPAEGNIRIQIIPLTDRVRVRIQDSGIGILPEDQERIYERFYKADASRHRESSGSGLGLAIVRKIIELHQGTMDVQSEIDRGTTFTITLPILIHPTKKH